MPENTNIDLFGFDELNKFFETMKRADQRRIILNAYRIGGKPLIAATKTNLRSAFKTRSKTSNLVKSIGFVALPARRSSVFVSAKIGARRFGNYRGFHGHLYDAGTKPRQTGKGLNRGQMPASNFFSNALIQTKNKLIEDSQNSMLAALDKLIQRNLKKQSNQ